MNLPKVSGTKVLNMISSKNVLIGTVVVVIALPVLSVVGYRTDTFFHKAKPEMRGQVAGVEASASAVVESSSTPSAKVKRLTVTPIPASKSAVEQSK